MKRIIAVLVLLLMCLSSMAHAELFQLYSGATGTTTEVVSGELRATNGPTTLSCDISSVPTATVNYRIEAHQGYLVSWPTNSTQAAIISYASCTYSSCQASVTGKTFEVIRSVISTPTGTTAIVRVTCRGAGHGI